MQNDRVIPASILDLTSGQESRGHRFLSEGSVHIDHADNYAETLRAHKVMADASERSNTIRSQVESCAAKLGAQAVIDDELLEEVTALVEWPLALAGNFEKRFLDVPQEALISSMKEHQKYFHMIDADGALMPHFVTVSNLDVADTSAIVAGNEKVIRPRLDDAAFFFETDKKQSLEARREKLKKVVFQAKLGTIYDKTERIRALATDIAKRVDADQTAVARTAELCKSDLVSNMVYEFPEMQGLAGSHYALNDGESAEVAKAIAEHYQPKFAGDALPSSLTGAIVGLADRLDTLVGIFALGQTPTGSKDPFALRRASVSILRLIVENDLDLDLRKLLEQALALHGELPDTDAVSKSLTYVLDRFKAMFEDEGVSTLAFQAVASKQISEPLDVKQRVLAVNEFNSSDDAPALAAANKRVGNILAKLEQAPSIKLDDNLLAEPAEQTLASTIKAAQTEVAPLLEARQYGEALSVLAKLRSPVDQFFEDVMVMCDDEKLRANRLSLLTQLRQLFLEIADISLLDNSK
jgi:glycyl-tRNA synthetase beta chain